jgi:Dockerin type I domain/Galactose oxidase, central domain
MKETLSQRFIQTLQRFIGTSLILTSLVLVIAAVAGGSTVKSTTSGSATIVTSQNWTQLGATTLSERQHSAVAFNPTTSQLIAFGGDNTVNVVNDTWAFDGTRWNRLQPLQSPSPRTSAAMTYFPVTGTIILFGGDTHTTPNGLLNGTWSFDGTTWTVLNPAHRPPARYGSSLAYDPVNHELVLFGGESDNGLLSDVWTFDGTDWTDRSTANGPGVRYGAVMAYDSVGKAVILFGGLGFTAVGTTSYLSDTWSWKSHQWTQLSPTTSPPGRWSASMAEGAPSGLTLFGGYSDTGVPRTQGSSYSDTWIWNGTNWSQSIVSGPGARYAAAMSAYPTANGIVLVAGCCNNVGGFYTDTWTFDGSGWTQHSRVDAPSVRSGAAAASDVDRAQTVLFGGFGGDGFLGDTWTNKGGIWSKVPASTFSPAGRFASTLAYDTQHHQTVLFGGQAGPSSGCSSTPDLLNPNHLCDDTWTFDGSSWTRQLAAQSPPYRSLAAMAFDPDTNQSVLFGGYSDQNTLSDTWTWDGTTWTKQSPSNSPPGLAGSSPGLESALMAWDAAHHQLILFGGEGNGPNGPQYFNETWQWTGSNWQQLQPQTTPPPLKAATLVFDPVQGGLVLTSGQGSGPGTFGTYSDTWFWDGATWTQLLPTTIPPPRYFASSGYDATTKSILLFGGGGDDGYLDDTWTLRPIVQLISVVSRKTHGTAGAFDVDLTNGNGIECRSGGTNGDYTFIFSFANTLSTVSSASVTSGTGSVASVKIDSSDAHNYIVNLTGVTNAQFLTVNLTNVTDSTGNFSSAVSASMGVLIGDVNGSGVVTSGDTNLCKAQALQPVTSANFRNDVNASGSITTGDVNIIKQNALSHL